MISVLRHFFAAAFSAAALLTPFVSTATETAVSNTNDKETWSFKPQLHGIFRSFFEWSSATGQSKFNVRNARLTLEGDALPVLGYYLQTDLCDRGDVKIVYAYLTLRPIDNLKIMVGQTRIPFSTESSRSPHLYYFVENGLVGKLGNLRSVGIKAGYTIPGSSIYLEGGIFNGSDLSNHQEWNSEYTYSLKANCKLGNFRPEVFAMSRVSGGKSDTPRFNQAGASLSWTCGGLFIEGEYIHRAYNGSDDTANAWNLFADYGFDVNWKCAQRLSFQGRFDGVTNSPETEEQKRLTIGTTARYVKDSVFMDFRINYEHYLYDSDATGISADANNRVLAGVILYF